MDPRFMVLKLTQSIPLMPNGFAGVLVYGTMKFIGGMPTGVALIKVATKTIHDLGAVANVINLSTTSHATVGIVFLQKMALTAHAWSTTGKIPDNLRAAILHFHPHGEHLHGVSFQRFCSK